jgi:hypothetical protein
MAAEESKKTPWGDALAPLERDAKTIWIDLGPVWQGDGGSLQLTLHVEPLHWRAHAAERRIVIRQRQQQQQAPQESSNTSRRGAK